MIQDIHKVLLNRRTRSVEARIEYTDFTGDTATDRRLRTEKLLKGMIYFRMPDGLKFETLEFPAADYPANKDAMDTRLIEMAEARFQQVPR